MPRHPAEIVSAAKRAVTTCSAEEAARRIASEAKLTLLDVREPKEFEAGTLASAVNIPRGLLEMRVQELAPDDDQPILLYCASGARSALAAKTLAEIGYTNVVSVDGTFEALQAACEAARS